MSLLHQLITATALVGATILIHLVGLGCLLVLVRGRKTDAATRRALRDSVAIIVAAGGLFVLHGIEIWAYALLFWRVHAVSSFDDALYFSTSTYTTIGYGDVLLTERWRIVGAIEGANGIILLGWSTAFFISVVRRIQFVEWELERET